ncbi:DUF4491 family protein [Oscillospiraceae bacterium MB08-C2-2]|nr:DUF4491 family protein [Oscillospiraceae bacterium MB08-C2-2]
MFDGILIGFCSFLIIGLFHPIVIKAEYYFSKRIFPAFLVGGLLFVIGSILVKSTLPSAVLGVTGFSCFWSIKELFEQEHRVKKGWFPANPKRENKALAKKQD